MTLLCHCETFFKGRGNLKRSKIGIAEPVASEAEWTPFCDLLQNGNPSNPRLRVCFGCSLTSFGKPRNRFAPRNDAERPKFNILPRERLQKLNLEICFYASFFRRFARTSARNDVRRLLLIGIGGRNIILSSAKSKKMRKKTGKN